MTDNPNRPAPDTGIEQPDAQPGAENTPRGAPGERPASSVADRTAPGAPPPGTNQGKNEPVPVSPTRPAEQSTTGSADPQAHDAAAALAGGGSSGDARGVPVPGERPAPGTSEERPPTAANPTGVGRSEDDATDRLAESDSGVPPAERQTGGSPTQAAQEGRPLAQGKTAGTNAASQAVVGRASAPDGEVSPR